MSSTVSEKHSSSLPPVLTGTQCRMARVMLHISTATALSEASGVGRATIERFERGEGTPTTDTVARLLAYFTGRDIRFTTDAGVIGLPPSR